VHDAGTPSAARFRHWALPISSKKPQEVEDVALGTWVFYRRADRGFVGIYRHFCSRGGYGQDLVLSIFDSFPRHIDGAPAAQVMIRSEKANL
jgi:hypothetical protein